MRWFRGSISATIAMIVTLTPMVSEATSCGDWTRLDPAQKDAAVLRMIDGALASNRGRSFEVNREAIGRCLRTNAAQMVNAFDDVCSSSRGAGMQAIDEVFTTFVYSCVG
jgi:hypothetical protein